MEVLLWILIIILVLASLGGVVVPIIPDTILLWVAFFVSFLLPKVPELPVTFWIGMSIITLLIIGSDILTNVFFVQRYGGSKWATIGAVLGLFLGLIILGPIGVIIGPFILVFVISLFEKSDEKLALKKASGTVFAFFSSTVIKLCLQVVMIIWFFAVLI